MADREKEKKLTRPKLALRTYITICVILLCIGSITAYTLVSGKLYYEGHREALIQNVLKQCAVLGENLEKNEFKIVGEDVDMNAYIESVASFFDGRLMIINNDYRIIKDTYLNNQDGLIMSKKLMEVMNGEAAQSIKEYGDYIEIIYPVVSDGSVDGVILVNASTRSIDRIDSSVSGRNIIIAVIIILLCVLAAFALGWVSVRGIHYINNEMEELRDGNMSSAIPVKGFKEFQKLTENYNATINRLMVIDSSRQEFVSNVSHELKTPITSMKVLADSIVSNESADLDMYKEFMTDIANETKIINDLLTLVKTDKKSASMNIEEQDINALLEIILKRVTPIADSRGIEIIYEKYRDVVAEVDEVKLSLALSNIIENAIKYNIDNGWVRVTLNADHKYFYIKVADSGVGIPDDCKEHVFERFYRVDKARSRDTGGTGLGLAITRNVIRMHRGNIKLYSESGQGTTFTIKIPIKKSEG